MASARAKVSLALLLACASSSMAAETVWSAFAFVLNGERTPLRGPGVSHGSLTSVGAQQMWAQGSLLRNRWLSNNASADSSNATTTALIANIEKTAIDNTQMLVYSSRDDFVTAGALAFMQGLYPPQTQAVASNNGGIDAAVLADGTLIEFPLGGYMYPNIRTLSLSESESVWLEGFVSCTEYLSHTSNLTGNPHIAELANGSLSVYQHLWSTIFKGTFPLAAANFGNAYYLYDYAAYQYNHNETIRQALHRDELDWLAEFASIHEFAKNGDLTISGLVDGDMIRAVAGRTLAHKIVNQFQQHISTRGEYYKLNLMFGSYQPMLAFFSLSGLSTGHYSGMFQEIPQPGGTMIFELFSDGTNTTSFPDEDDLWVRFLYRNGTEEDAPVYEYPLFGLGISQTRIKYRDFVSNIKRFSIDDVPTWCNTCNSVSIFCSALRQSSSTSSGKSSTSKDLNLSPAVAGVIGAVMAIAVIAVAIVSLAVFGRFGVHRNPPGQKTALGGFKGAEKMASDKDLSVARNGAKHERVGSWELGGPGRPVAGVSKDEPIVGATRMRHNDDDDDDHSSIMGSQPVQPRESL